MRWNTVFVALFLTTLGISSSLVAEESGSQEIRLDFPITPIEAPLTSEQKKVLDLFMDHPEAPEMQNLPRSLKQQLPLYIAAHENQLDRAAIVRFNRSQLLQAGMTFQQILMLQTALNAIQNNTPLSKEQNQFLEMFITTPLKKNETIALDGFLRPLYGYVQDNPNLFSKKTADLLYGALFRSIGMTSREISRMKALSKESQAKELSQEDVTVLRKFILASQLQGVEFMAPQEALTLDRKIQQNSAKFSALDLYIMDSVVRNSPSLQKFAYQQLKASSVNQGAHLPSPMSQGGPGKGGAGGNAPLSQGSSPALNHRN